MPIIAPRFHLFEIEDQVWCPSAVRAGIQSVLQLVWDMHLPPLTKASSAAYIGDVILENLPNPGTFDFIDNCAGGGGPTPGIEARVNAKLRAEGKKPARFVLTDLHPHINAWERLAKKFENITYVSDPVDARDCMRLARDGKRECRMFSLSFHHMDDPVAAAILKDAFENADAIVINELLTRDISSLILASVGSLLLSFILPIFYMWHAPAHMLLTYVVPLIPLAVTFDGIVSWIRGRTPEDILQLLKRSSNIDLTQWEIRSGTEQTIPPLGSLYWWMAVKKQK